MMSKEEYVVSIADTQSFKDAVNTIKNTLGGGNLSLAQLETLAPQFQQLIDDRYTQYVADNS